MPTDEKQNAENQNKRLAESVSFEVLMVSL
jgi:hypothetical protein